MPKTLNRKQIEQEIEYNRLRIAEDKMSIQEAREWMREPGRTEKEKREEREYIKFKQETMAEWRENLRLLNDALRILDEKNPKRSSDFAVRRGF